MSTVLLMAATSAHAQPDVWRDRRIDGSSEAKFEASVAALQNELPSRRREDLEIALAAIWMSNTVGTGGLDVDGDGDVDVSDTRILTDATLELLTDIQRGDLLPSIEGRQGGAYTAADYVKQLDGLGYDEVLDLAGRPDSETLLPTLKQTAPAMTIDPATGKALNEAIEALNLKQYGNARKALGALERPAPSTSRKSSRPDRLSPYERSIVELLLFHVAYAEGKLAEARDHLQSAVSAGGMSGQEVSAALAQIRVIEARLTRPEAR